MAQCLGNLWKNCSLIGFKKRSDSLGKGLDFECGNCLWKRPTFLLLNPGSALKKFAAIVTPENKPTKVNWISHGPVPWKFVEKLF